MRKRSEEKRAGKTVREKGGGEEWGRKVGEKGRCGRKVRKKGEEGEEGR